MKVDIRPEEPADYDAVSDLIGQAFKALDMSDHREHFLVQRLRNAPSFIPALSLVAEKESEIIGYILLTAIKIKNDQNEFPSLALAPVAVLPKYQKQGIGGMLIKQAHIAAIEMGFHSVIVLGHAGYYPRFGYKTAAEYGISLPFDVPDEYCMVVELREDALRGISGMAEYPKAFFE